MKNNIMSKKTSKSKKNSSNKIDKTKNPQQKKVSRVNRRTKKIIKIKYGSTTKIIKINKKKKCNKFLSKNKKGGGNIKLVKILYENMKRNGKYSLKTILLSQLHDTLDFSEQVFTRYYDLLQLLNKLSLMESLKTLTFSKSDNMDKIDMSIANHLFTSMNGNFALLELVNFNAKSCCCDIIYNSEDVVEDITKDSNTIDKLSTQISNLFKDDMALLGSLYKLKDYPQVKQVTVFEEFPETSIRSGIKEESFKSRDIDFSNLPTFDDLSKFGITRKIAAKIKVANENINVDIDLVQDTLNSETDVYTVPINNSNKAVTVNNMGVPVINEGVPVYFDPHPTPQGGHYYFDPQPRPIHGIAITPDGDYHTGYA
jgi:hypothetical protein